MPKLNGFKFNGDDKLTMVLPPYQSGEINDWLNVEDWGKQHIAHFDKNEKDIPNIISEDPLNSIMNQLKKGTKILLWQRYRYLNWLMIGQG